MQNLCIVDDAWQAVLGNLPQSNNVSSTTMLVGACVTRIIETKPCFVVIDVASPLDDCISVQCVSGFGMRGFNSQEQLRYYVVCQLRW